jgi:LmbE family N-acetylglucosaminyl deacetylase
MNNEFHLESWQRVLFLAPHPDDDTLAAGGLVQRAATVGAEIRVIYFTNGDNNPWPQRVLERRWRIGPADRARWGARRREEACAALACLGLSKANACFWGYPDQGLSWMLLTGGTSFLNRLTAEIDAWRPTLLLLPSLTDLHPDHSALALLGRLALLRLPSNSETMNVLSYVVHGPQPNLWSPYRVTIRLTSEEQRRKRRAIGCHATQTALSRRRFLAYAHGTEHFFLLSKPEWDAFCHPVARISIRENQCCVGLAALSGHAHLLQLIGVRKGELGPRLLIPLPKKSDLTVVREAASGAVVSHAKLRRARRCGVVTLPQFCVAGMEQLFVKLSRSGWGFFDIAGWREFALSPPLPVAARASRQTSAREGMQPRVCCVIPCYNVAALCEEVVRGAARYVDQVIAVDDGSTDETGVVLRRIAAESQGRVQVVSFKHNRGKGAALLAGFQAALQQTTFDVLVTLDGDRQHQPADIPRLVRKWQETCAALVVGERQSFKTMPLRSRLGNIFTGAILQRLYPGSPRDTQSGFRALARSFVEEILRSVPGQRYETELRILLFALRQGQAISTVPIVTVYLDHNRSSHFRPLVDSLRIARVLLSARGSGSWFSASSSPSRLSLNQQGSFSSRMDADPLSRPGKIVEEQIAYTSPSVERNRMS